MSSFSSQFSRRGLRSSSSLGASSSFGRNNTSFTVGGKKSTTVGGENAVGSLRSRFLHSSRPVQAGFAASVASFFGGGNETKEAGKKFLEENSKNPHVVCTPSGLQYKILKSGKGQNHPTPYTPCDCHYEGKLIDGRKFDSSYDRGEPTTFAPNQVIAGWTEAMQMMVEGDLWELYIPSDLGYGDRGAGALIPGGATLVFKMELLKINGSTRPKRDF